MLTDRTDLRDSLARETAKKMHSEHGFENTDREHSPQPACVATGRVRKGLWARLSCLASTSLLTVSLPVSMVLRGGLWQDNPSRRGEG